jgi:hypothetical protein
MGVSFNYGGNGSGMDSRYVFNPWAKKFKLYNWECLQEDEDPDTVARHNGFLDFLKTCQRRKKHLYIERWCACGLM